MRVAGTKEHTIWNNHGGASAHFEQAKKEMKEKYFRFPALGWERRVDVGCVNRAFKWRICENQVVALLFVE